MFACADAEYALPPKDAVLVNQLEALTGLELDDEGMTQAGQGKADSERLFRVSWVAKLVMWAPMGLDAAEHLQVRQVM